MNILQSIFYGFISGLSAFLPISLFGHQSLLNLLFGISSPEPVRDLLVHMSILLAIIFSEHTYIERFRRESRRPRRSQKKIRQEASRSFYDFRFLKASVLPLVISFIVLKLFNVKSNSLAVLALFFFINGVIIYFAEHIPHANKDSNKLSAFDGMLLGIASALCVFPGISYVGASMSCMLMRGAERSKAFHWISLLMIPLCVILMFFDFIGLFTYGMGTVSFVILLGYLFSAIISFIAAFAGIYLMRFLSVHSGFSVFAFYSWGAALLSFILYLNT